MVSLSLLKGDFFCERVLCLLFIGPSAFFRNKIAGLLFLQRGGPVQDNDERGRSFLGRTFAGLSEGGALPERSLKRVLKCDAVDLEEASGRQLRCDQSFGVIHLRVDCH